MAATPGPASPSHVLSESFDGTVSAVHLMVQFRPYDGVRMGLSPHVGWKMPRLDEMVARCHGWLISPGLDLFGIQINASRIEITLTRAPTGLETRSLEPGRAQITHAPAIAKLGRRSPLAQRNSNKVHSGHGKSRTTFTFNHGNLGYCPLQPLHHHFIG